MTDFRDRLKKVKPVVSFIVLLLLLACTFSYAMFQGGFVSWFLFYSFLPIALYSILLSFYPMAFQIERVIDSQTYNAGDSIDITLILTRKLPFPLFFLLIEDDSPNLLEHTEGKRMLFPWFRKRIEMNYKINSAVRGEHDFQFVRVKTGDVLGFIEKEKKIPLQQTILVYPSYHPVVLRSLSGKSEQGAVLPGSRTENNTTLIAGIREYEPGDRFSRIDWKASARSSEMMTKEFEARRSNNLMVILDMQPSCHFEELVAFAASYSRAAIRHGIETGLLLPGKRRILIPPRKGAGQEHAIFYQLAKVKTDQSKPGLVLKDSALAGDYASFTIMTAQLSKLLIERAGKLLNRKGSVMICLIKGQDTMTSEETVLAASASQKGIQLFIVDDTNCSSRGFSGVKQA
ncbi:DUF58 domain-containing protein [Siminovitchia sediminis]|uniref:DUF58 domain-containing protein n=1 Tax=Siminovitchia sediminis TaxID=1274353 RepID=A0ABW4KIQ5_9BACI